MIQKPFQMPDNIKIIYNEKEFFDFFQYKTQINIPYPLLYPCLVEKIYHDGGLMGDHVEHKISYCPENGDFHSFVAGYIRAQK